MKFLFPLALVIILSACDYHHMHAYRVENNHTDTIRVSYVLYDSTRIDTIYPGESRVLEIVESVGGRKGGGDRRHTDYCTLNYVESSSNHQVLTEDYWIYAGEGSRTNDYLLIVDETVVQ